MKREACTAETDPTKPGLGSKTVAYSDTADIWPGEVARQLLVFSAGTLAFVGLDGEEDAWTFTAGMAYPQAVNVFVARVKATGTSVAAGDVKAIR